MAPELREASWSAPVLWRFGKAGGTRGDEAMLFYLFDDEHFYRLAAGHEFKTKLVQ
jgi:hypothetical protein